MLAISHNSVWLIFAMAVANHALQSATAVFGTEAEEHFDRVVAPLLARRCLGCHSQETAKGGLDLSRRESVLRGGDSGQIYMPAHLTESRLWQRVVNGEMPPEQPLEENELLLFRKWLVAGLPWGSDPINPFLATNAQRAGYNWWSLQPLRDPKLPDVEQVAWSNSNDLDRFILRKLESQGLQPSPPADPPTLVRRVYFDLIGLPPDPQVTEQFTTNPSPAAWQALVDQLLNSPAYGERWGRHWLDVARFGESDGFEENQARPHAWPYRDWVIQALNDDLPYDTFAKMQIAGDLIDPGWDGMAAAGFMVAGIHNTLLGASDTMQRQGRQDELEELIGTLSQTFLGLTANCARCHDHKFDPISTREYYQLVAAVAGVTHGTRELAENESPSTLFTVVAQAAPAVQIHVRGSVNDLGDIVPAGGIAAIQDVSANFGLATDAPEATRRLKLADWIASPQNPLFLRTIVNRIWHHHFGNGLVKTPNDLGFNGGVPSHPDLLDWLSIQFRNDGLRMKSLHRRIVTSNTYQQASALRPEALQLDTDNDWLWRYSPRRIEAEVLRDSILQISGALNPQRGGPGFMDVEKKPLNCCNYYIPIDPVGEQFNRRTIYRFSPRGASNALLDTFDCPDSATAAPRRNVTTTPLQALSLMNNAFVIRMAKQFSERVIRESGENVGTQVRYAWMLALGRLPSASEEKLAIAGTRQHGLNAVCRAIFNANAFVIID